MREHHTALTSLLHRNSRLNTTTIIPIVNTIIITVTPSQHRPPVSVDEAYKYHVCITLTYPRVRVTRRGYSLLLLSLLLASLLLLSFPRPVVRRLTSPLPLWRGWGGEREWRGLLLPSRVEELHQNGLMYINKRNTVSELKKYYINTRTHTHTHAI